MCGLAIVNSLSGERSPPQHSITPFKLSPRLSGGPTGVELYDVGLNFYNVRGSREGSYGNGRIKLFLTTKGELLTLIQKKVVPWIGRLKEVPHQPNRFDYAEQGISHMTCSGRMITKIEVESAGDKDDWLTFSFGLPDPAAAAFRVPFTATLTQIKVAKHEPLRSSAEGVDGEASKTDMQRQA
jgi:hypothetical protein